MSNYYSKSHLKTSDSRGIKRQYINVIARSIATIGLVAGGNLLTLAPLLALPASPNTIIENQATGVFTDDTNPTGTQSIVSNIVSVKVAEVTGIAITTASTPTATTGSIANFDFKITNAGNDPTKFFLPTAPADFSGGTLGVLQVVAYIDATGARFDLAVPIDITTAQDTNQLSDPTLGGNIVAGSIPADAAIVVRVPITVTALGNSPVSVTLGDPHGATPPNSAPYILGNNNVYTVDNPDGTAIPGEADGLPLNGDAMLRRQEASGIQTVIANAPPPITISGTVFSDADANVTIDGSDAGTNAGSLTLTIYAIDPNGNVLERASVQPDGTYTLSNVPALSTVKLRLSDDAASSTGTPAPIAPSLPADWFQTGKNLNGAIDGTIATLGDITVTTTTTNLSNQNFGIRETYILPASAPVTCTANFTNLLNTGVSTSGTQLPVGANDLNWTTEWLDGPTTTGGVGDPYSRPRPVGVLPAVVTGNLAFGAWVTEPNNAKWISYPFRLSTNSDGNHNNADLDGTANEGNGSGTNTSDTVRLKFTSKVTLPSNANTIAISLPVGVSVDNQFVSLKVNGVENLVPIPAQDPQAESYKSLQTVNIQKGWKPGINTIEVILDSGPPLAGFFLGVQATTTQICGKPNMLLVKRITAINNVAQKRSGTALNEYEDDSTNPYDDNDNAAPTVAYPQRSTNKWPDPSTFLLGSIDGGTIAPNDSIEYTIYFLSAGDTPAKKVLMCDRVPDKISFNASAYNNITAANSNLTGFDRGIVVNLGGQVKSYSNIGDDDVAQYFPPGTDPATVFPKIDCGGPNTNGAVVVNLGDIPNAQAIGTPDSYGFIRFQGRVK